jgi:hypothetical protein
MTLQEIRYNPATSKSFVNSWPRFEKFAFAKRDQLGDYMRNRI